MSPCDKLVKLRCCPLCAKKGNVTLHGKVYCGAAPLGTISSPSDTHISMATEATTDDLVSFLLLYLINYITDTIKAHSNT